jgi:hypothetical protein
MSEAKRSCEYTSMLRGKEENERRAMSSSEEEMAMHE